MNLHLVLILLQTRFNSADDMDKIRNFDYCKIPCGTIKNTVCYFEFQCGEFETCRSIPVGKAFREEVLNIHNELRDRVARGGEPGNGNKTVANMAALSYDMELEYIARCWANRCKKDVDICRSTSKFDDAGQNLYRSSETENIETDKYVRKVVNSWYSEVKNMAGQEALFEMFDAGVKGRIDGFSHVVWAKTTHVGCARSKKDKNFIYVCNYAPKGNKLNLRMYEYGQPCSKCRKGVSCNDKYKGLCGRVEDPPEGSFDCQTKLQTEVLFCLLIVLSAFVFS